LTHLIFELNIQLLTEHEVTSIAKPILVKTTEIQQTHNSFGQIAAMHLCCITAHLYEVQISIGVFAMAQACCEPVLQRSTEQQGSCLALTVSAVLWCCITAHLNEEQFSIGVFAMAQACCDPVLQMSTEQQGSCLA